MTEDVNKIKKYVEHYIEHISEHADKLTELSKEVKSKNLLKYFQDAIKNIQSATASLKELLNQL
jgi:ubiquinone biosynthesis protein UbiJ